MEQTQKLRSYSQQLRKEATKEERHLWYDFLKNYPIQFKRQYLIDQYIVDFYCYKAKLVIELDGSQHYEPKKQIYDQQRTADITAKGFKVLRFTNLEIKRQFSAVCEKIDTEVQSRL